MSHFFVDGRRIFKFCLSCLRILLYFHMASSQFLENMLPALVGEHYFANRHKGSSLEKLPFWELTLPFCHRYMPPCPLKKTNLNLYFFNIFAFRPHQAPSYSHHTCHLKSFGSIFHFPATVFTIFLKMCSPPTQEAQF